MLQASLTDVPQVHSRKHEGQDRSLRQEYELDHPIDAANPGDDVALTVDIGYPGWYYLGVGDLNSGSYNMTYSLGVAFKPVVDRSRTMRIGDAVEIKMGQ